ncbi:MAG TPA: non-homologous end-joining DNA ligase [Gammaproteobacteria bacterium]|nr:non-homologous end-joining DNA ligase [Gammaproteobacteria bacterium]
MAKPTTADLAESVQFIEPMYAQLVLQLPDGRDWLYEVKFDGYRCLAARDAAGVTLWSRRGNDFTAHFPNIAKACEQLPARTLLDGEIVAIDENGRISFNLLQHHRSQAQALLFYVFDILMHRGINLLNEPLTTRREVLTKVSRSLKRNASAIALSESIDATPAELIGVVKEFGFEGVIAKRKNSCYESGKRSGAWLKYKVNNSQEFVVAGYTPGNPLDAVIVGYYDGEDLIYAAKVRNGFVPRLRREVWQKLKGFEIASCPFANLPEKKRTQFSLTREEMKNCIWLKPQLVAQVEFTEWTPDGHLRHSNFIGLRDDKDPREVVREQSRC